MSASRSGEPTPERPSGAADDNLRFGDLFADIPTTLPAELVETLFESTGVRVERIVSHGQRSPDGFWYDQPWGEWVVVLRGAARLRLDGQADPISLKPGDYVNLPPHCRHRVEWTASDEPTVWLAIHYREP